MFSDFHSVFSGFHLQKQNLLVSSARQTFQMFIKWIFLLYGQTFIKSCQAIVSDFNYSFCVYIYLYRNRYESLVWMLVKQTQGSSDVLRFSPDCVGGNPINDGIVQQEDVPCLDGRGIDQ